MGKNTFIIALLSANFLIPLAFSAKSITANGRAATHLMTVLEGFGASKGADGIVTASRIDCSVFHSVVTHQNKADCRFHAAGEAGEIKLDGSDARKLFSALTDAGALHEGPGEMSKLTVLTVSCQQGQCQLTQDL